MGKQKKTIVTKQNLEDDLKQLHKTVLQDSTFLLNSLNDEKSRILIKLQELKNLLFLSEYFELEIFDKIFNKLYESEHLIQNNYRNPILETLKRIRESSNNLNEIIKNDVKS